MEYELVLTHHGIKGQRWGVRRFQTKSGGLTSAGRKRYGVGKDSDKKKETDTAKKNFGDHEDYTKAHTKKSLQSMSNEELAAINKRLAMEEQYKKYHPQKKSLGKKIMDTFIIPAATDIAKDYTKRYMKQGASKLEDYLKNNSKDNNKTESSASDSETPGSTGKTGHKGMKWGTRTKTEKETYDGPIDVGGEGTSKRSSKNDKRKSNDRDTSKIYTDDWEEHREEYSSSGKTFISGLLGAPSNNDSGSYTLPGASDTVTVFKGLGSKMSNYSPKSASLGQAFIAGFLEPPKS